MDAFKRILFLLALGAAGAFAVRSFLFERIYIASNSMAPTLPVGSYAIVDTWSPWLNTPKREDIVMFDSPINPDKGLVKRVIAVGGDTLEIRDKKVFVNGQPVDEPYTQFVRADEILKGDNLGPLTVPSGHVFVMGDNRDVSGDSRDWRSPSGEPMPFLPVSHVRGVIHLSPHP